MSIKSWTKKAQVIVYLIIKYEIIKKYSNKYDNILGTYIIVMSKTRVINFKKKILNKLDLNIHQL